MLKLLGLDVFAYRLSFRPLSTPSGTLTAP